MHERQKTESNTVIYFKMMPNMSFSEVKYKATFSHSKNLLNFCNSGIILP